MGDPAPIEHVSVCRFSLLCLGALGVSAVQVSSGYASGETQEEQRGAFPEWELRRGTGGLAEGWRGWATGKICQSGSLKVSYWEDEG